MSTSFLQSQMTVKAFILNILNPGFMDLEMDGHASLEFLTWDF